MSIKTAPFLSRMQSVILLSALLLTASLFSVSSAAPASAVSTGVCWAWGMEGKAAGNFLTDGTHDGVSAVAGTYALSDFKVNSSIYPTVEAGSISDGTYSFGVQPPYSFIWNGSAPTTFQRAGYTNGFRIYNGSGGRGASFVFDVNYSSVSNIGEGANLFSSGNTISLSPTTRSACDPAPVVPAEPVIAKEPPAAVQFLTTLTPPKLTLSNGNLLCMAGEYRSGYTINGVIQGDATAKYKPNTYVFNVLIDGVPQPLLAKTISGFNGAGWDQESTAPRGSMASCSVTVTVNNLTNIDKSTDNNSENVSAVSAAKADLAQAIATAESEYLLAQQALSKTYEDALVANREAWRLLVPNASRDFNEEYKRIANDLTLHSNPRAWSAALMLALNKLMTIFRTAPAIFEASNAASAAAKIAAKKAALDAKTAAIAKANASYGTVIESMGYGVLIP